MEKEETAVQDNARDGQCINESWTWQSACHGDIHDAQTREDHGEKNIYYSERIMIKIYIDDERHDAAPKRPRVIKFGKST